MKIVVIDGTGMIGSKTVAILRQGGHEVVAASRKGGVNTLTGEGLKEAMAGAQVVIDLSNAPSVGAKAVLEFFETSGRNLLAAEAAAGVRHHVALSIVGTDRVPDQGYYRAKVAQEKLIEASTIPYTIIRSTQFLEFLGGIADASTDGRVVRLAPSLLQPIAADDVAAAVTEVALANPRNGIIEIAGPERAPFNEIVACYLKAIGDPQVDFRDREQWFVVRISHYTTGDRQIKGTVLTFTNVTAFRASIDQAIYEREFTKAILNTVADPLVVLSADQRVRSSNRAFYTMFGVSRDETQGGSLDELGNGAFELAPLRKQFEEMLAGGQAFQPVEAEAVDVNEVIEETIAFVDRETQRKNVSLRADLAVGLPSLSGDRVQLQQVILNLMMNGIEAMAGVDCEPKSLLIQSALPNQREFLVSIADTGPGIEAEHAGRLFAPFFTTKPQGIGMGLRISRSIIEAHGGRLWADKNEPRGAVFHFIKAGQE